jgi:hypothetical protein
MQERDVSVQTRETTMQFAMDNKEGSVVAACIIASQESGLTLGEEQRQEIFEQSVKLRVWQALKPLIQTTEERNMVMQLAIEHGQWDVVDSCLLIKAPSNSG